MTFEHDTHENMGRCAICGEVRPLAELDEEKHTTVIPGSNEKIRERVMYCGDKAECAAAAPAYSVVAPRGNGALAQRQRRGIGE